jgi:hypothetical protein
LELIKSTVGNISMVLNKWNKLYGTNSYADESFKIPMEFLYIEGMLRLYIFFNEKKRVCCENVNAPYNEDETS